MTATMTTSTWQSTPGHPQARSSRPATTPRSHLAVTAGHTMSPQTSPTQPRSPRTKGRRSPSPGYFGLTINDEPFAPDSNPGQHAQRNWIYSNSSRGSKGSPPQPTNDNNPALEAFRRQSEAYAFNLSKNFSALQKSSAAISSPSSSKNTNELLPTTPGRRGRDDQSASSEQSLRSPKTEQETVRSDMDRYDSPMQMSTVHHSVADHQHARLSLPTSELQLPPRSLRPQRSDTVPMTDERGPTMMPATEVGKHLALPAEQMMILDLRVHPQYALGRIRGALNLCIPTTLLKRPTFTVQKLADTFTSSHDKAKFANWKQCAYIIVYDATSAQPKDAAIPLNVLKKFSSLGWDGSGIIVKGGFNAFSKACPDLVDTGPVLQDDGTTPQSVSVSATSPNQVPIAGGCAMPSTESAANPFFGNIRQNMDLLDGVGQMPIKQPSDMSESTEAALPAWLREASGVSDKGKQVSDKFLSIERSEQKRMQKALSGEVKYGTPSHERSSQIQVAGIEKGSKNRYNNIFPYDHSRVKLQGVPNDGCDYINASHVQAAYSNRRYIATQAPIPATFDDFWRLTWEQDVRVIVMLTAESEGGQLKSHPYWVPGEYGPLKLKKLSERQIPLERTKKSGPVRPTMGTRRSTQPHTNIEKKVAQERKASTSDVPTVTVRHFTLSHSSQPFQPMREITQLQYTQWPDFGAPASPTAMLGLIEHMNKYVRNSSSPSVEVGPEEAAPEGQRPILVHCSAGCGRTGTFCTVDSVIDMLKRQKLERNDEDGMDVDVLDNWISRDDIDLVAKTVNDFRYQRLSMVQNLRQFVLCYESILQWLASEEDQNEPPHSSRRGQSFQGALK